MKRLSTCLNSIVESIMHSKVFLDDCECLGEVTECKECNSTGKIWTIFLQDTSYGYRVVRGIQSPALYSDHNEVELYSVRRFADKEFVYRSNSIKGLDRDKGILRHPKSDSKDT